MARKSARRRTPRQSSRICREARPAAGARSGAARARCRCAFPRAARRAAPDRPGDRERAALRGPRANAGDVLRRGRVCGAAPARCAGDAAAPRAAGLGCSILPGILGSMLARMKGNGGRTPCGWISSKSCSGASSTAEAARRRSRSGRSTCTRRPTSSSSCVCRTRASTPSFHPFDWRMSIPELGRELAAKVHADPADEVFLVAHSMGGLVARAAVSPGWTSSSGS